MVIKNYNIKAEIDDPLHNSPLVLVPQRIQSPFHRESQCG